MHKATKQTQKIPELQISTSALKYKNQEQQRCGKNKCIWKNIVYCFGFCKNEKNKKSY